MNINALGASQSTHMKKMDGSGQGGANSMKETMQSLSSEDRVAIQEQMSSLSQADRKAVKEQISQLDKSDLSPEELKETMLSMISSFQPSQTLSTSNTALDTYA